MSDDATLGVLIVPNRNWEAESLVGVFAGKRPRPRLILLRSDSVFPAPVPDTVAH